MANKTRKTTRGIFLLSLLLTLLLALAAAAPALGLDSGRSMMLINKEYRLPADDVPQDLVKLNEYMRAGASVQMSRGAAEALGQMIAAMKADGIADVYGTSGYRSYSTQSTLYKRKVNEYLGLSGYNLAAAEAQAGTIVAPPGASEHQTGLAIDLTTSENGSSLSGSFADTKAGRWLAAHCWEYGFILRYSADKTAVTGYIYEPWHFRYVGQVHARYMAENGLCLEEYMALLREQGVLSYDLDGVNYAVYYRDSLAGLDLPAAQLSQAYAGDSSAHIVTLQSSPADLSDLIAYWGQERIQRLMLLSVVAGYTSYKPLPGQSQLNRDMTREGLTALMENFNPDAERQDGLEAALEQGRVSAAVCYFRPQG